MSRPHVRPSAGDAGPAAALFQFLPGIALAAATMLLSVHLADWLGAGLLRLQGLDPAQASSPVSGVLVAILLGIVLRNTLAVPPLFQKGLALCAKSVLRLGIVCVGIKLSLLDVFTLGAWGLPVVALSIAAGLVFIVWVNARLKLPPRVGALIAAGSSICGITAIVSVAAAIKAEEKEVAYAVANITLFGLIAMFTYPYLAPHIFATSEQIGLFLGIAIHETAQVVGAALTFREVFHDDVAFQVATVAKLTRNLFLTLVIPVLSYSYMRRASAPRGEAAPALRRSQLVPAFILGFLAMALLRTIGDSTAAAGRAFGLWTPAAWKSIVDAIGNEWGSKYLLGAAMAAVGLSTSLSVLRGVGFKPFAVGLAGALVVGLAGAASVLLLGRLVGA